MISRLSESKFVNAYNILCAEMTGTNSREAIYPTFCRIPENGKSLKHTHFEAEIFYIVNGVGEMNIQNEKCLVKSGDLIRIPPFADHELVNSSSEDLVFLSVYSEDFEIPKIPQNVLITAAPPTPNGPLHLGHISGPYLASDLISRYFSLRGSKTERHCGTDDHQNYVNEAARLADSNTENFRKHMRSRILNGLAKFNIAFDEFLEPKRDSEYQKSVLQFYYQAVEAGIIQTSEKQYPYCDHCDEFLFDALLEGICPHCKEESHGACEHCGFVASPYVLEGAKCARCKVQAQYKQTPVSTFDLSKFFPLIKDDLEILNLAPRIKKLCQMLEKHGAVDIALSTPSGPGIPIPNSEQHLHVWFEMAAHYKNFALSDKHWVHCFGFDNSFYYLLFIPTLLRAMYAHAKLPDSVVTNEFLSLEGFKFSTSRKHAIWADEFDANAEFLRLYLTLHRPAYTEVDFSRKTFEEFSKGLSKQMERLHSLALEREYTVESHGVQKSLVSCNRITRDVESAFAEFDLRRASRCVLDFMDRTLNGAERGLAQKLMLRTLATLMAPFMPKESEKLLCALGVEKAVWVKDWVRVL